MKMKQSSSRRVFVDYYTRHVISRDSLPLPWRAHTVARLRFILGWPRASSAFAIKKFLSQRNPLLLPTQAKLN
jgi:hypothetical protein